MNLLEKFKKYIADTERYTNAEIIDYSKDDSDYLAIIYKEQTATIKERYSHIKENDSFMMFENITY